MAISLASEHQDKNSPMLLSSPSFGNPAPQWQFPDNNLPTLEEEMEEGPRGEDGEEASGFQEEVQDWENRRRGVTIEDLGSQVSSWGGTEYSSILEEDEEEWDDGWEENVESDYDDEEFQRLFAQQDKVISPEDVAKLRALEYKLRHRLTDDGFDYLPYYFPDQPGLESLKKTKGRLQHLSNMKKQQYDCCIGSCMAFTGEKAELDACTVCKEPRRDSRGKARAKFSYASVKERLEAMMQDPETAKLMEYRSKEFPYDPEDDPSQMRDTLKDVFDGSAYRSLQQKRVVVDGEEQEYRYFNQSTDIALGFSTDGFCPFRKRKKTCWPLLLFNYNLPPDIRFHAKYTLCVGVIPGPKKPKDPDSFLWPFVQECKQLARGITTFSVLADRNVTLRAYPILGFGDMPAVAMIMKMKGHNGVSPCRWCKIKGVLHKKTYYVPLARVEPEAPYDPRNLPLRTHTGFLRDGRRAEDPRVTGKEREARAKASGVKGVPILSEIPSYSFPQSFPFDFMHLIYENLIKNLILLWTGEFKGMDHDGEAYVVAPEVWNAIAAAGEKAGSTIPAAYGARPKNIVKDVGSTTAETWSFWALYLGPVFLRREFKNKDFYHHFVDLVVLLNMCLQFEYTKEDVEGIREGFACWVEKYEKLYFQYDMDRVLMCLVTIHALLHIADGIEACGPVGGYWSFPMERFCGKLRPYIKSMRRPWANLDNYIVLAAQLDQVKLLYKLGSTLITRPVAPSKVQFEIPSSDYCDHYKLGSPRIVNPSIPDGIEQKLAAALSTRYTPPGAHKAVPLRTVRKYFKTSNIEIYGRIICSDGGDTIRAAAVCKSSGDDAREASFVRVHNPLPPSATNTDTVWQYHLYVDQNAALSHAQADEDLQVTTYYGEVQRVFLIRMPIAPELGIDKPEVVVYVEIQPCNLEAGRGKLRRLDIHLYPGMKAGTEMVDLTTVQSLVARMYWDGSWVVFDRSGNVARPFPEE